MRAIPAASLYHTKYRELPPKAGRGLSLYFREWTGYNITFESELAIDNFKRLPRFVTLTVLLEDL